MKTKISLFIKKYWILILFGVFVFSFIYSHLTSHFVSKKLNDELKANHFIHYSLEEYEDYFEYRGYEYQVEVGDEYSEESFNLVASIDNQKIEINHSDNGTRSCRLYKTDGDIITLPFGVEWEDSYQEIKNKMNLNLFNTRFSSLMRFGTLIDCTDIKEYTGITIKAKYKDDYALLFWFDENKELNEVYIIDYDINKQ